MVKTNGAAWDNYEQLIRKVAASIDSVEQKQKRVDTSAISANPSKYTTGEVKSAISQLEGDKANYQIQGNTSGITSANEQLKNLYSTLGIVKKEFIDVSEVVNNPANFSPQYIETTISKLKDMVDNTTFSSDQREESQRNLTALTESYNNLKIGVKNVAEVINNPENFSPKQIEYTINSLKTKVDNLALNDPKRDGLKKQIESLGDALDKVEGKTVNVDKVVSNIKTSSLNDLKQAAKQLEEQIAKLDTTSKEYIKGSAQYGQIKNRIDDLNGSWKKHEGTIKSVMNRLVAYIGIYGAFNLAQQKLQELISGNLQLSDSMADIQKTTGLAAHEVSELSKGIDGIDTRTSQEELHNLAYEAGKLGITGKENLMQFVEAGNQVLVALGEDLGGTDAIKNLMKINDVLGETKKLGIEKALLATGSAINEVGQTSTASEGYIADFAQRMAGVASQSHLTMAELVALGGTTDALGQNVEVSATTLNKVFVTLQSKTEQVARAAGVSVKALKELLDQGDTMKAFQMVLDGLGQKKGGLGALAPIFKDMGSDGARMIAVMSSMVSGSEMLQQQLDTSNVAFEQATSLTKEYNVKNESAQAILQRMGNSIKEYFVNSTFVDWLKAVLVNVSQIPGWIERNYTWVISIRTAIIGLTVALTANKVAWIANLNALGAGQVWLSVKAGFLNLMGTILAFSKSIWAATTSVAGFKAAWESLKTAMAKNWVTIILVAIAAAGTAIYTFATKVSAAAKAWGEYTSEVLKAQLELHGLRNAIDRANKGSADRGALIAKLNENYGSYLNFMLTETNYAKNQAWAYNLINSKLRETLALKMKEKLIDKTMDKYAGPLQDTSADLYTSLSKQLGETVADKALATVSSVVESNIGKSTESINNIVNKVLKNMYGFNFRNADSSIRDFISLQKKMGAEIDHTTIQAEGQAKTFSQMSQKLQKQKLNQMAPGLLSSKSIVDLQNYISLAQSYMSTIGKTSNAYKIYEKNIINVQKRLAQLGVKAGPPAFDGNPYTEKELKKMETAAQKAAKLALRNQNNTIKELLDGVDEYFAKEKKKIEDAYTAGFISDTQMKLKLEGNEQAHNIATAELRKSFLKEKNNFNAKEFGMTEAQQQKLKSLNVKDIKTNKEQRDKDQADQEAKLAESLEKEAQLRVKHKQEVDKIIQDNDDLGKVKSEYEEKFSLLGVYSVGIEKGERELSEKRMQLLTEFSKNSRTMEVDELQTKLLNNQYFADLTKNMTEDQYKALLLTLQQYLDDTEEAEAKAKSRRKRVVDTLWENSDENKKSQENIRNTDADTEGVKLRQGLGLADESDVNDIEIIRAQARMDAMQREYDFKVRLGQQDLDLQKNIADKQSEIDSLHIESLKLRMDKMRGYTDAISAFTDQMGQAAFSEVKDRKAAGKQLINALMDTTKKMVIQWATRKAMNLLFKRAENVDNAAQAAISIGTTATQAGAEAGISVSKAGVDVAAGIASGTAKEVGSKGWVGLAVGAAIAAVLGGLLSMVQSKMTSAFGDSDVSSSGSSSSKTLAPGMLTYADGRYPVLGADGNVYSPAYQSKLNTGVYNNTSMGIFSEKEPEMVVSGPTTKKLMLDYPHIMNAIQTIDRGGRVKTYADGKYPSTTTISAGIDIDALAIAVASVLKPTLDNVASVNAALHAQLSNGIQANINKYGKNGLIEQVQDGLKFYKDNKING